MSVAGAIRTATERLEKTSDTARLDAELLMAHALGTSRSDMLLRAMSDAAPSEFDALVERRARREPIAYILGEAEFFGRSFIVTSDVLIPRSDSETVIEAALEVAPENGRVLDLGIGSGALLLTILAEKSALTGIGIDASLGATAVAAANAGRLGLAERARILKGDWNEAGWSDDLGQFDLVLCNPPYVELSAELEPDVREFEPHAALFAGDDGLDDYRVLIPQLSGILAQNGTAIFEIGYSQAAAIDELATNCGYFCTIREDLGGRPRAVILTRGVGKAEISV